MRILMTVVPLLLFGGFAFYMMQRQKSAAANSGPALQRFLQMTGYRVAELGPAAPIEAHAAHMVGKMQALVAGRGQFEQQLVRDYYGAPLYFSTYMGSPPDRPNVHISSASWTLRPPAGPRLGLQIASRHLSGVGKAVGELMSNVTRQWSQEYPHQAVTGDPAFDAQLMVFSFDPNAARAVLADPNLRQLLLSFAEVDISVRPGQVTFSDPSQKNILAAMGGTMGAMTIGFDYGKMFEAAAPVHERAAQTLATLARACA
jgi:hypothetical protein